MNINRRLAKLEATFTPGVARCRTCGYQIRPDLRQLGALIIYADGSFWDTTPRCACGHVLMANGQPYPAEPGERGSHFSVINVSHYALCGGGDREFESPHVMPLPRRLPPEWWLPGTPPKPPGPREAALCPGDAQMIALAIEAERMAQSA